MGPTARELNRATLDRQLLLGRRVMAVPEAVRRLVALQSQEPSSPYLSLWARLADFDADDLDAAFAAGELVRSPLIRLTLHAVHADDWPVFYNAMVRNLRASRVGDRRFLTSGLSAAEVDALVPEVIAFLASPRTEAEIKEMVAGRITDPHERAWWALRRYAPAHRVPTGGPWSFASTSFIAAPATRDLAEADASTAELLRRYLQAYGPATAQDFAQFTMLRGPAVKRAVTALGDEIEPAGGKLMDLAGRTVPDGDTEAPPRLLPMWDNVLLAYADRSRVIAPQYRPYVIRRNGDVLPTLLVDGYVTGIWRPVPDGIEATAFAPLPDETWKALAVEAADLLPLLAGRDPALYARYAHWWDKGMPAAEVRCLPG